MPEVKIYLDVDVLQALTTRSRAKGCSVQLLLKKLAEAYAYGRIDFDPWAGDGASGERRGHGDVEERLRRLEEQVSELRGALNVLLSLLRQHGVA